MSRKILFITGTRAEYGILKPLLKKIQRSKKFDLSLIVTGLHLLPKYGESYREIKKEGFKKVSLVKMYDPSKKVQDYVGSFSVATSGISEVLKKANPHFVFVVGDRLEAFAGAVAASLNRVPIIHLHGGEKTKKWHLDENIRHAITKLSNIHFTSTDKSYERVINLGEEKWRVYNVGALGLDSFRMEKFSREQVNSEFNLKPNSKLILGIFHPPSMEKNPGKQVKIIINSILEFEAEKIFIYPNNDPGSEEVIRELEKAKKLKQIKLYKNLEHKDYVSLLKRADLLIGNSSSGIIEAPFLGLPVINVGSRNLDREHTSNVFFISVSKEELVKTIKKIFRKRNLRKDLMNKRNFYGDGHTAERIIKILEKIPLGDKLIKKQLTY